MRRNQHNAGCQRRSFPAWSGCGDTGACGLLTRPSPASRAATTLSCAQKEPLYIRKSRKTINGTGTPLFSNCRFLMPALSSQSQTYS